MAIPLLRASSAFAQPLKVFEEQNAIWILLRQDAVQRRPLESGRPARPIMRGELLAQHLERRKLIEGGAGLSKKLQKRLAPACLALSVVRFEAAMKNPQDAELERRDRRVIDKRAGPEVAQRLDCFGRFKKCPCFRALRQVWTRLRRRRS